MPVVDAPRIKLTGSMPAITVSVVTGSGGGGAVDSVNGQTGTVVLDAADVGALPDTTVIPDISGLVETTDPRLSDSRTPTAHTHPTSDVTGLDTALAGKETAGAASAAQGYAIQRANHTGTQAQSTVTNLTTDLAGKATTAQGAKADTALQPGASGLLAVVAHDPGSVQNVLATTSDADVDAANLVITFTTPPSGKVLVEFSAMARRETAAQYLLWTIRESTTTVETCGVALEYTAEVRVTARFYVTGLTPGSSHTYKWGHYAVSGGSGRTKWGQNAGPAVMTVTAAP